MNKRLRNLKKRSKSATIGMIVVSIILLFLLLYYAGNGFHIQNDYIVNTSEDLRVIIDTPEDQQIFYDGDSIEVTGGVWGEIPKRVYVWDERFNVPIDCSVGAGRFGVTLYATDISRGYHTLCVQAQSVDGKWSAVRTVTIEKKGTSYSNWIIGDDGATWTESNLPQPLGIVFRPVEEVLRSVVVYVSGGTSPDDLNGDNIPDEIQQSPAPPRYNPMNVPLSALIIFALIIIVILVIIFYVAKPYIKYKQGREREIRRSPEQRAWVMDIKQLKNKQLRASLASEKRRRKALERKVKIEQQERIEALSKRPVHIYLPEGQVKAKKKEEKK